ncbi:MAG: hypothetical protein ACRD1S_19340, partial [Vicinamibacterales bacterium]
PDDVHTWSRYAREEPLHPFSIEGPVQSALAASRGSRFVVVLSGVTGPLVLTARRDMNLDTIDPPTGEVRLRSDLNRSERLNLEGLSSYVLLGSEPIRSRD